MANEKSSFQMGNEVNGYGEHIYLKASMHKTYPLLSQENVYLSSDYGEDILKAPGALTTTLNVLGWERQSNGKWKYMKQIGIYISGNWHEDGGQWYYFDDDEYMAIGWRQYKGLWYYLQEDDSAGYMVTNGWIQTSGKWYYLQADGAMAVSKWIPSTSKNKTYWVNEKGEWVDEKDYKIGWEKQSDGRWKYVDENGSYISGDWVKKNGQ